MAPLDALSADDVTRLIQAATTVEAGSPNIAARRGRMVEELARLLDADAAHWAWGRGDPLTGEIAPLAMVEHGYTPRQLATLIEHALHPESIRTFQARVMPLVNRRRHAGVVRRDVIPDVEWQASAWWQSYVKRLGFDSWVHAICYQSADSWSCLHFLRRIGRDEFGPREAVLADLALFGVAWLKGQSDEPLPAKDLTCLTPRQRTVMLLLLEGLSRKEIANRLDISEHTVDDHLKALYARFSVRSSGELAARFLKMA